MRRDSIFYQIFQQFPTLLRDLLPHPPDNLSDYSFNSVEVKETSFRIDGVFRPNSAPSILYFTEIQFQPDPLLYERLHSEISIYTYRNSDSFHNWQAIVIYPNQATEQTITKVPPELFASGRIRPIYLDQIQTTSALPLRLLILTTLEGERAINEAKRLVTQAQRTESANAIMEMIATIMVYKFTTISRDEVYKMLNYTRDELKQTRFYQDVQEETQRSLVWRMLRIKFPDLPTELQTQYDQLSIDEINTLSENIFNFHTIADLTQWLDNATER